MSELVLSSPHGEVRIVNEPTYSFGSADNVRAYRQEIDLGEGYASSAHGVLIDGVPVAVVRAGAGASGVHAHSALIIGDRLYLALANQVACFALSPFALLKAAEVDWATCFGLHFSPERDALISHGELQIARLSEDCAVVWTANGADIFTGEFALKADYIEAHDFNGDVYRFDYETGASVGVAVRPRIIRWLARRFSSPRIVRG